MTFSLKNGERELQTQGTVVVDFCVSVKIKIYLGLLLQFFSLKNSWDTPIIKKVSLE